MYHSLYLCVYLPVNLENLATCLIIDHDYCLTQQCRSMRELHNVAQQLSNIRCLVHLAVKLTALLG